MVTFGCSTVTARADEDGISFWILGFFGSLAATPQQPGWSLGSIFYNTNVSASGVRNIGADVGVDAHIDVAGLNCPIVISRPPSA
jgi:hypothetical protein